MRESHKLQRTESGFKIIDLLSIYAIFANGNKFRKTYFDTTYYWYEKGLFPAKALSLIVTLYFNIAQPGFVNPMNAWDRYIDL